MTGLRAVRSGPCANAKNKGEAHGEAGPGEVRQPARHWVLPRQRSRLRHGPRRCGPGWGAAAADRPRCGQGSRPRRGLRRESAAPPCQTRSNRVDQRRHIDELHPQRQRRSCATSGSSSTNSTRSLVPPERLTRQPARCAGLGSGLSRAPRGCIRYCRAKAASSRRTPRRARASARSHDRSARELARRILAGARSDSGARRHWSTRSSSRNSPTNARSRPNRARVRASSSSIGARDSCGEGCSVADGSGDLRRALEPISCTALRLRFEMQPADITELEVGKASGSQARRLSGSPRHIESRESCQNRPHADYRATRLRFEPFQPRDG